MITADNNTQSMDTSEISEWHQFVLNESLSTMAESSIAQQNEIEQVRSNSLKKWSADQGCDPLFELTSLQEPDTTQLPAIIEHNSQMIANAYFPNILPAPFAKTMMTPNAFYEKHAPVYQMAKSFLCPILFNEDADVVGIGSINPVIAAVFAQAIQAYISETAGITPFISKVRLDYESWAHLCNKHFSK